MDINPNINPEDDRAPTKKKKKRGNPRSAYKQRGVKTNVTDQVLPLKHAQELQGSLVNPSPIVRVNPLKC